MNVYLNITSGSAEILLLGKLFDVSFHFLQDLKVISQLSQLQVPRAMLHSYCLKNWLYILTYLYLVPTD